VIRSKQNGRVPTSLEDTCLSILIKKITTRLSLSLCNNQPHHLRINSCQHREMKVPVSDSCSVSVVTAELLENISPLEAPIEAK